MKIKSNKVTTYLLCAFIAIFLAFYFGMKYQESQPKVPAPQRLNIFEATDPAWITFVNTNYGYEISYPKKLLQSFGFGVNGPTTTFSDDTNFIELAVSTGTLDDVIASSKGYADELKFDTKKEVVFGDNVWTELILSSDNSISAYMLENDGKTYEVIGSPEAIVSKILMSFQLSLDNTVFDN